MHNTRDCCWFEKDGTEKSNFRAAKKGEKNQSHKAVFCVIKQENGLAQEGDQEKKDTTRQKHCSRDSDSDSE